MNKPPNLPFDLSLALHNGNIKIGQYNYKLLDDISIQGYVNSVGERLIPEHQKNLPEGDPNKLHFRFYVIDNPIPNAFAFPNGMIFIHTGILDIMENEAELAIVLGREIAHVTHEHGRERYEMNFIGSTVGNLSSHLLNRYSNQFNISQQLTAVVNQTYSALRPDGLFNIFNPQPALESQSDRVGLQYALLAGYDVREAIVFWNKMTRLTDDGSFKAKLGSNFRTMLSSANFSYGNPLNTLGDLGFNVLSKMFLETVYTSHPKSKARAQALNQLILNTYKSEDLNSLDKGDKAFQKYIFDLKMFDFPVFPYPPPLATAQGNIPINNFKNVKTLNDIDYILSRTLNECGYKNKCYYKVPNGFAIITDLEQIDSKDGHTLEETIRWSKDIKIFKDFSLLNYIEALFGANKGRYRLMIFWVSSEPLYQDYRTFDEKDLMILPKQGIDRLPSDFGKIQFTPEHKCAVLIYEFEKSELDKKPKFLTETNLTGWHHLKNSNILNILEKHAK